MDQPPPPSPAPLSPASAGAVPADGTLLNRTRGVSWVTWTLSGLCTAIWLWVQAGPRPVLFADPSRYGLQPPAAIWDGAYWALLTPNFVHAYWWHLAANLLPFLVLGRLMERAVGSARMLAFCLTAGPVVTAWQLALSGSTGYGFSGILLAVYGFEWGAAGRHPRFRPFTDWLMTAAVVGLTALGFLAPAGGEFSIGNAGHAAALAWGAAVGAAGGTGRVRAAGGVLGAAVLAGAIVPLFWAPWLVDWLEYKAHRALRAGQYAAAEDYLHRALAQDPESDWSRTALERVRRLRERGTTDNEQRFTPRELPRGSR